MPDGGYDVGGAADAMLALAGLHPPPDEVVALRSAFDGVRACCEAIHRVPLADLAPITRPD